MTEFLDPESRPLPPPVAADEDGARGMDPRETMSGRGLGAPIIAASLAERATLPPKLSVVGPPSSVPTALLLSAAARTPKPEAEIGSPVAYRLRRVIGHGGYGEVWEAMQTALGRVVAVKRVRHEHFGTSDSPSATGPMLEHGFRQEALTTGALEHPNIVPVHDFGIDELGRALMVMKLIKGSVWADILERDFGRVPVPEFLARHLPTLIDVAQAVAFAHSRGVMHRDIKPSQVMVGEFGEVILGDWGLAVVFDEGKFQTVVLGGGPGAYPTRSNASCPAGTPAYMAPEQTDGTADRLGPWTDVYLLGGTLYLMLTGAYPHPGVLQEVAMTQARGGEVADPVAAAKGREVPQELAELAMDAMRPEPVDRVPSAKAFVERIQDYLSGTGRRKESAALAAGVAARLAADGGSYEALSACVTTLDRANELWPGNPEVPVLRHSALHRYGTLALERGDLALAQAQAAEMAESGERTRLLRDIARAEERRARRELQRRIGLWTATAMTVLLSIAAGVAWRGWNRAQEESHAKELARAEEAKQKLVAQTARAGAEDLLGYMLGDLLKSLEPINKLDLLDGLSHKAVSYFSTYDVGGNASPASISQRALAYESVARVFTYQQNSSEALGSIREAVRLREAAAKAAPGDTEAQVALGVSLTKLGGNLQVQGDLEAAASTVTRAVTLLEALRARGVATSQLARALSAAYLRRSVSDRRRGANETSLAWAEKALDSMVEATAADPSIANREQFAEAYYGVIGSLNMMGRSTDAIPLAQECVALRRAMLDASPTDANRVRQLAAAEFQLGNLFYFTGSPAAALPWMESSSRASRKLSEGDPGNKMWETDLCISETSIGEIYLDMGRWPDAMEHISRAVRSGSTLFSMDPADDSSRGLYGIALVDLGRACAGASSPGEANAAWELADEVLMVLADSRKASASAWLDYRGRALAYLGCREEAIPQLQSSLAQGNTDPGFLEVCKQLGVAPPSGPK